MTHIITNRIKTPDGTILTSRTQNDYVCHVDKITGAEYCIDGGNAHRSHSGPTDYEDLTVTTDDSFEVIRRNMEWGAKDAKGNIIWRTLLRMNDTHIQNILKTQKRIPEYYKMYFINELQYRVSKGIKVENKY